TAEELITFNIEGNGKIVGVDNGNPASRERYKAQKDGSWQRKAFSGKALVIVESTEPGSLTLTAESATLPADTATVYTNESLDEDKTLLHVEDVVLYTEENVMPTLPEQVKGIFSDGTTDNVDVEWEEIDKELLETTGKFEVTGRVTDSIQATATVIVRGVDTIVDTIVATAQGKVPDLPS